MTTTVEVTACCDPENVQVRVKTTNDQLQQEDITILQDGESVEVYVCDGREVTVREVPKT